MVEFTAFQGVGGRETASPLSALMFAYQSPDVTRLHVNRELRFHMKLWLLINWHWDRKITQNTSSGLGVITRALINGRGGQKRETTREKAVWVGLSSTLLEEGAISQGTWVPYRSWKRQGNRFSPIITRKEDSPVNTLILIHWDPFVFLTCRTKR